MSIGCNTQPTIPCPVVKSETPPNQSPRGLTRISTTRTFPKGCSHPVANANRRNDVMRYCRADGHLFDFTVYHDSITTAQTNGFGA